MKRSSLATQADSMTLDLMMGLQIKTIHEQVIMQASHGDFNIYSCFEQRQMKKLYHKKKVIKKEVHKAIDEWFLKVWCGCLVIYCW